MKKTVLMILVLIFASSAFASSDLYGDFVQTKGIAGTDKTFKSYGNVLISGENGIAWFTQKPFASTLVVTEDHMSQKIRDKVTSISAQGNEVFTTIAKSLQCVFFKDYESITQVFFTEYSKDGENWKLFLKPKDKILGAFIKDITVYGDTNIKSLLLNEESNDYILYEFENMTAVPESLDFSDCWIM